ncbi:DUF3939 domain-containing protein [Alkalihalobacterium chitinilyticum]|uniref:DUF3939 domain-containing protein n=1 Tax=Alkalihalobacterium chitinilyticum TaxID=2980103 RepID=A0ABT5VHZ4_9BACI|nr:DUF3939 domain-containing protein [Alkalihalobacterium chitinilyticum]MDE5414870.1 DUF3939 domain-containing protein [Alkalihalobacterium chitinilyticum]
MFWKRKRKKEEEEERNQQEIDVSIDEVRQAIKQCASDMPMGISLRSLVNDDHSINFKLLKNILKGIPKQKFYMSKETFEVFEDAEKAKTIDKVQVAVDQYISEKNEIPVIPGEPTFRISYFLIKEYLHHEQPDYPLYIDPNDRLVTHRRPNQ